MENGYQQFNNSRSHRGGVTRPELNLVKRWWRFRRLVCVQTAVSRLLRSWRGCGQGQTISNNNTTSIWCHLCCHLLHYDKAALIQPTSKEHSRRKLMMKSSSFPLTVSVTEPYQTFISLYHGMMECVTLDCACVRARARARVCMCVCVCVCV